MDPMYGFSTFEHGIHDADQKLQYYRKFIIFLLGELEALQEAMCNSCREKCTSSPATRSGSQSFSTPNDSALELRRRHIEDDTATLPQIAEMNTPRASSLSSPPMNKTTASNSMVERSTELNAETNDSTFYAQKDDLADTAVDVEFIRSFSHQNYVCSVCFSRDGRYFAVAIADGGQGSIAMYDVESRAKYCELKEYASQYGSYKRPGISSLCFSTNGRYIAAGDYDNRLIIWDIPQKRIRSIFQVCGVEDDPEVRFSPDGRLVAFNDDDMALLIINMRDNSRKRVSQCSCFDFNPKGRYLATGNTDGDLTILDLRTGKVMKRWNTHGTYLHCLKFTSDGKRLLCSYNGVIENWDVNDVRPTLIWKSDIKKYAYVEAISPDNRLIACSNELWDINSGKRQWTLEGHNDYFRSVDFSTAGTYLAISSFNGAVSLWRYAWTS